MPRHIGIDDSADALGDVVIGTPSTGQSIVYDGTNWINGSPTSTTSLTGTSSTPTVALGAASGTGASATVVGTNLAGKITLNSGTGVLASGTVMTMTFANSLSYANGCSVTFSAGNTNFAAVISTIYCTTTQTTVTVLVSAGLTVSSTYIGYYQVIGY